MVKKIITPPETTPLIYPYIFPNRESIGKVVTLTSSALLLNGGEVISQTKANGWFMFEPNHPCFDGHWPGHPIVPNYLWHEMVGQTASLLLVHLDTGKVAELVPTFKSATAKYGDNVYPNDTVYIQAELIGQPRWLTGGMVTGSVRGTVTSNRYDKPVAKVRLRFTALPRKILLPNGVKE